MLSKHPTPRTLSRYRRPLYAMGAAAIAVPLMLSSTSAAFAQSTVSTDAIDAIKNDALLADFQNEYLEQVNSANIWANDVKLSDEIGPRLRGTAAELEAVNWVADTFESYGIETEIEEFPVTAQTFADVTPSRYTDEYASWQFRPSSNGPLTGVATPVTGQLVDIGATLTGIAERTDLVGKIVLADWNNTAGTRTQLLTDLKTAGVAAVVLTKTDAISSPEALPNVGNLAAGLTDMVVVGSASNQGKRMRTLLGSGDLSLSIVTDRGTATSHNAIGVIPAASGNPDAPIIYLGAHIDSVLGSPGASDNGSGVSIMLEIARIMSQHEYDAEIRFGAWGAEESGYQGSNYHVKTVMTAEEQARTLGAWNMDMAGTSYPGNPGQEFKFWALTADTNRLPLAPSESTVLDFSNQVSVLSGNGDLPIGTVSRSDHQPFHDVGIKAAVFSWMHWAGGTNIILEPAYHQTTDTLEFVSEERMGHAARILGGGAFRAALNDANLVVTDENGDPAASARVAMTCEGDEGWRDAGTTDAEGKLTTLTSTTSCDFVALAENGARGQVEGVELNADTAEIEIELEANSDPVIEFSATPEAGESGWFQASPTTITVAATNDFGDSDITVEYSFDGDTWQAYVDGVTLTEQGVQTVFVRATDGFGNVSEASIDAAIDSVAPALQLNANAQKRGAVSGTASDATSGIASVQYRIGAGEWIDIELANENESDRARAAAPAAQETVNFSAELKLGAEATAVHFRTIDVAGHVTNAAAVNYAAVPGGLSNTGAEAGMPIGIAAAALLLVGGGAILFARHRRSQVVNDEA